MKCCTIKDMYSVYYIKDIACKLLVKEFNKLYRHIALPTCSQFKRCLLGLARWSRGMILA